VQPASRRIHDKLVLRMAVREDAHACANILKESADDGLVARSEEVDPVQVMRQIEFARAASNSLFLVAVVPTEKAADDGGARVADDDDELIIGLLLLEGAPLMRLHDVARLTMAVTRAHRSAGVGRALVVYALECADASGLLRKVELLVRANNEVAISLYKALGFVEEGRLRARLKLEDGTFLDDVCMARFKP
jgi:ribosomal protein S18 acetylase RimI-like enzyme